MENEPEVIRERMQEKRTELTEKLEALEQQVLGVASTVTNTVESVKEGVQETVEAVKNTVEGTVGAVKNTVEETVSTVKETFDLRRQVDRHPWAMLGGSVGVGLVLGLVVRRRTVEKVGHAAESVVRRFRGGRAAAPRPAPEPVLEGNGSHRAGEPGMTEQLLGTVKEGMTRLRDAALGTLFGTLRDVLINQLPQAAETQVKAYLDDALSRLKEAVQHPPQAATPPTGRQQARRQTAGGRQTQFDPETGRPIGPGSW